MTNINIFETSHIEKKSNTLTGAGWANFQEKEWADKESLVEYLLNRKVTIERLAKKNPTDKEALRIQKTVRLFINELLRELGNEN